MNVDVLRVIVPLWHEEQRPVTCVWSTRVTGFHSAVTWQLSQALELAICVAGLAVTLPVLIDSVPP